MPQPISSDASDLGSSLSSFIHDVVSSIQTALATIDWGAIDDFFKSISPYVLVAIA